MHWRYNLNTLEFEPIDIGSKQHYEPLLKYVYVPTLVIDIYLVEAKNLAQYISDILNLSTQKQIFFDQIIFDATLDPLYNYAAVTNLLNALSQQHSIRFYLAVSQFELKQHSHLIELNYPAWLFVFKTQRLPTMRDHDKQYKFSCLNRNPAWHRLLFYTLIKQSGLLDQFVYSFYDHCPYQQRKITLSNYFDLRALVDSELYQRCLTNLQDFPIRWHNEILGKNDHSVNHDAYTNTWCNIVTETSATVSFTSEKIWKPIAAGQLFLVVGAPGTTKWLKSLNINTFDDDYDNETDVVKRFNRVVEIVHNRVDTKTWWLQNKTAIEENYYRFRSGNIEKMLLEPIIAQLNHK